MKKIIKSFIMSLYGLINYIYFKVFFYLNKEEIGGSNQLVEELPGSRVLILAPHIDDETIGCGGAILKYRNRGISPYVCYLTRSQKKGSKASEEEVALERKKEAYLLFERLGLARENMFFLSGRDGDLRGSHIGEELTEVIEKTQPDTIFLPIFLDTHQDHYAANIKLLQVYRKRPDLFKDTEIFLYEAQSPITQLYSNVSLDISEQYEEKMDLLKVFKSQKTDFAFVKNLNRINGLALGLKQAEVFINMEISDYAELLDRFINSSEDYYELREKLKMNSNNMTLIKSYKTSLKYKGFLKERQKENQRVSIPV